MKTKGLFTDLYELTMMQGYFNRGYNPPVAFEMFFRRLPFKGGFAIFAGLEQLISELEKLSFSEDDIAYLESLEIFSSTFLQYLRNFKFSGTLYAVKEGAVVFPDEPLIRVEAPLMEAQLIEGLVLNTINFQTLIATKSARVVLASGYSKVLEFGLRRAQGQNGALAASRAAFIGGAAATSNTLAGQTYGIPVSGTMAHSWVLAFESEEEAFMEYAKLYPKKSIFLIDTYDTLGSGIESAIKVGAYLKEQGHSFGVRLDSGDLHYLSVKVRKRLDEAGFRDAKITVSNELNEEIIQQLVSSGAPIDFWGVGTDLVTGGSESALTGVYKLVMRQRGEEKISVIKISDNPEKSTVPGVKQLVRFRDSAGSQLADLLMCEGEALPKAGDNLTIYHPIHESMHYHLRGFATVEVMHHKVMEKGERTAAPRELTEIQSYAISELHKLDSSHKRLINPHIYKVSLSRKLRNLKTELIKQHEHE